MNIYLPNVLKKRKSLILLITLLFSSALFMSASSVLFSIQNINSKLYGSGSDVLVIYNEQSTTPFTSVVSPSFESSLSQINGISAVSGEILIPIIHNTQTLIVRGVNLDDFKNTTDYRLMNGDDTTLKSTNSMIISNSLLDKLNLQINNIFNVNSALNNVNKYLKVIGSYEVTDIHSEEILVSPQVARSLSVIENGYSHYRIKFDPSIITKNEIKSLIESQYTASFSVLKNNNTEFATDWEILIEDYLGNTIIDEEVSSREFELDLSFGQYNVFISERGNSENYEIFVDNNIHFNLSNGDKSYQLNLTTKYNGNQVSMDYQIFHHPDRILIRENSTSSNGTSSFFLNSDQYQLTVWYGSKMKNMILNLNGSKNIEVNISNDYKISIIGLYNGSSLLSNNGYFVLNNVLPSNFQLFLDNETVDVEGITIPYSLQNGIHEIKIVDETYSQIIKRYQFNVDPQAQYVSPVNFTNYAKFQPGKQLNIDFNSINIDTLNLTNNGETIEYNLRNSTIQFTLPTIYGQFNFNIFGFDIYDHYIDKRIEVFISDTNKTGGLVTSINQLIVNPGDLIKIWYNEKLVSAKLNNIPLRVTSDNFIKIPNGIETGQYQLNISTISKDNLVNIAIYGNSDTQSSFNISSTEFDVHLPNFNEIGFDIFDQNHNESINLNGVLKITNNLTNMVIQTRFDTQEPLYVPDGKYKFEIISTRVNKTIETIELDSNMTLRINLPIIFTPINIHFTNVDSDSIQNVELEHLFLHYTSSPVELSNYVYSSDFPVGIISVSFSYKGESFNETITLDVFKENIRITVPEEYQENIEYDKWVGGRGTVNVSETENLLSNSSGPLALSNILIISETALILILLIISSTGIFISFMYQNRRELKILHNLGFTKSQIVYSMLKYVFLLNIIINLMGGYLGFIIANWFFRIRFITVFGVTFYPIFTPVLWITSFLASFILIIIGAFIGLNYTLYLIKSSR